MAEYPIRPRFFCCKFTRRMGKVCLGNDLGADVCWLLAFIAATEDAKGYRDAVSFYNEDLATRTGISVATLKRAREKAVNAGWLHYEPGARGRAARYWVLVPKWADGMDDLAGDEKPGELTRSDVAQPEPETRSDVAQPEPETRSDVAQPEPESVLNVSHSLPIPIPSSSAAPAAGVSADTSPKEKRREKKPAKKPGKDTNPNHAPAVKLFADMWQTAFGARYSFQGGKDSAAVRDILAYTKNDLTEFRLLVACYLADRDDWFVKNGHDLATLYSKLAKVAAAAARTKPATSHIKIAADIPELSQGALTTLFAPMEVPGGK